MGDLLAAMKARCGADGEFALAARYWTGVLRLDLGDEAADLVLEDGRVTAVIGVAEPDRGLPTSPGHVGVCAPAATWDRILADVPEPYFNDVLAAHSRPEAGVDIDGDVETLWQYYPAIRRVVDLLRAERRERSATREATT